MCGGEESIDGPFTSSVLCFRMMISFFFLFFFFFRQFERGLKRESFLNLQMFSTNWYYVECTSAQFRMVVHVPNFGETVAASPKTHY